MLARRLRWCRRGSMPASRLWWCRRTWRRARAAPTTRAIGACAAAAVALWEAAPPSVLSTPARAAAKAAPGEEGSPERELFGHKGVRRAPETPAKARQPAKQSKARAGLLARFDQLAA